MGREDGSVVAVLVLVMVAFEVGRMKTCCLN